MLNEWHDNDGKGVYTSDLAITGGVYFVVVEYYERSGDALIKFWWERIGELPTPTPVPNRPPVAVDDFVLIDEYTAVEIDVLANDSDPHGDRLVLNSCDASSAWGHGGCTDTGVCTYTPPKDFYGTDTFSYTIGDGAAIKDGAGRSASARVTVIVNPVNDPPLAVDNAAVTHEGVAVEIDVLANDSDPDGAALTVSDYTAASVQGGVAACTSAGVYTYTPPAGFIGADTFGYPVSDGKGSVAIATITVMVNPTGNPQTVKME